MRGLFTMLVADHALQKLNKCPPGTAAQHVIVLVQVSLYEEA